MARECCNEDQASHFCSRARAGQRAGVTSARGSLAGAWGRTSDGRTEGLQGPGDFLLMHTKPGVVNLALFRL